MPQTDFKKGMVLAAGLGTRLLPITESLPKPLVPILNMPNILHSLFILKSSGVTDIILNLHHLGKRIEAFLGDGRQWGMKLSYSHEEKLLGTGGGVKKAEPFFEGKRFVLLNCDFISNIALEETMRLHLSKRALATMVLYDDKSLLGRYSKVGVDKESRLCLLPKLETKAPTRHGIFTGIHLIEAEALAHLEEKPCGINEVLYPYLMENAADKVFGLFPTQNIWLDTGDIPSIWASSQWLLKSLEDKGDYLRSFFSEMSSYQEVQKGVWSQEKSSIGAAKTHGPVVLGKNINWGKNVSIGPGTIIGDNASFEDNSSVERSIVMASAHVAGTKKNAVLYGNSVLYQN